MSKSMEDDTLLECEIDYRQTAGPEYSPSFTIPHERVTRQPGDVALFDRNDPDAYEITRSVKLEDDRSLFAAIRQAQIAGGPLRIDDLLSYCTQQISRFNKFRLDPGVLSQPSRLPDPARMAAPRLGYHGEDLAATLYHLNDTEDPALDIVREKVRAIDPSFADFEFSTVGADRIAFASVYSDPRQTVPSARLSAGTLIYIGLIALVSTSNRPPVLMIEEPENGLTPQAVKSFYQAVRGLAYHRDPEQRSQVLVSSHSPFVICEAWTGQDRDFIHQVKVIDGKAHVRKFGFVISEQGIHLRKNKIGKELCWV